MSDLSNLIERLEKATGPDRGIDADIFLYLDMPIPARFADLKIDLKWDEEQKKFTCYAGPGQQITFTPPAYTGSLDAALTLVPACCKDWDWRVRNATDFKVSLYFPSAEKLEVFGGRSNVLAIALCIAALEAREAMQ